MIGRYGGEEFVVAFIGMSEEDAYKLGETLESIYLLEILSRNELIGSWSIASINRAQKCNDYINKLKLQFSNNTKDSFNKGRKTGEKSSLELFDVLNKNQLKKYQDSLIEEVEDLKYKNNL